ncbi:hypothetical protein [Dactylosporangium sp. NPDC048998]|uniref:hypothetical protein n=1 Tax=Dactylosporangium sp. NPDC048998 TaxID=3363976 RepID=UPI00371593A5
MALDFATAEDNPVALGIAMDIAERIQEQRLAHVGAHSGHGTPVAYSHPDDPELVTDPHGHDLTLEQARLLWRALGELLASAASPPRA